MGKYISNEKKLEVVRYANETSVKLSSEKYEYSKSAIYRWKKQIINPESNYATISHQEYGIYRKVSSYEDLKNYIYKYVPYRKESTLKFIYNKYGIDFWIRIRNVKQLPKNKFDMKVIQIQVLETMRGLSTKKAYIDKNNMNKAYVYVSGSEIINF